ncbi:hypothetical protein GGX14DRAFT_569056 [Mycena pura]|uniref:Uncharacterized protein n=1 Tax=Mycena pura TaxID=153505 RepID=A0AAD6V842_9AGAR|nr:hypothetical protein GGX14DRAFT_569056 [Mycena pura]
MDAPKTLSQILRDAPGVPRVAFLYHYSSLDSSNLSRRVHVRKNMFDRARAMRVVYAYIQACLLHPALQLFASDGRKTRAVLKRFEDQRKSIVQTAKDDEKAAKSIDALERDLASSKERADVMIRRYNFIRTVKGMDKGIVARPPTVVNGLYYYQWDCGKTGAAKKSSELKAYDLVHFELGYKAFELAWQSPMTDGSSTFRQLGALLGGASPRETMTFTVQSSDTVLPPPPFAPARKDHKLAKPRPAVRQQPAGTQDLGTFSFCLTDHKPVCILGWSISCYWPDGGKSEPTIEVDHESHYIFSDRLSISVDNSRPTRWHCKVTFVIKSSYNFPDLL